MRDYMIRRLLLGVVGLIGVSIAIFILMRIVPGDVALIVLKGPTGEGEATPQQVADMRHKLGIDRPMVVQYFTWVKNMATLDFGKSLATGDSVRSIMARRLPVTFELATLTMVFASVLAIAIGVICAVWQDTWVDYALRVFTIAGLAVPSFWAGTIVVLVLVIVFHWMPPVGFEPVWKDPVRNLKQIVWPALALGLVYMGTASRMTRSQMLEVFRQDFVRTAFAKGLRERTVIYRHTLKNALLPVITIMGIQYAFLLGGTVVMEQIFNLPGLGKTLLSAIGSRDYPVIQTLVMFFAVVILAANLLVDLLYAVLDPRVRYG